MSTSVNPSAAPLEAPKSAGPKALEPAPRPFGGPRVWLLALLLIAGGIVAWYFLKPKPAQTPAPAAAIRTAAVRTGNLQRSMRITGTTVAGRYTNIAAPLLRGPESGRALTLVEMVKPGTSVKKGTVVAQIDTQAARDHIDDVEVMVQSAEADIRKRKAEQAIEMENLRQTIRLAQSQLDKAKLDIGAAEIRTVLDQEILKLSVEEYDAAHKASLKDINIRLAAQKADMRLLEIARERQIRHRQRHEHDLVKFTIRTPMEGLVVMLSIFRGGDMGQVQVGDQMAPNQTFMKIVDPNSMLIEGMVNQVESEHLRVGQPVVASFDAFPGIALKGRINSIGAIAIGGFRQSYYMRNIPVKISLLEQDARVIPDLSAAADVRIKNEENAVLVPLEAVHEEGGKTVAFVREGPGRFKAREITLGLSNNTHAAVASGLKPGEVVALQRP
ncbi:MAG TPA: HlyD family efflux transporter periplasmic adaptor subunit [Bryobacteraceae bacterium]|nr:HlyD family efflux transporter periplasmic adaptor subunit [Bryobacteraceae bacterium]